MIDNADVDQWLAAAATENGFASPYFRGDANLDGSVDVSDFNIWNSNLLSLSLPWDNVTSMGTTPWMHRTSMSGTRIG